MTEYVSSKISHRAVINVSILRPVEIFVVAQSLQSILVHFIPFLHITHWRAGHHVHMLPRTMANRAVMSDFPSPVTTSSNKLDGFLCDSIRIIVVPQAAFFLDTNLCIFGSHNRNKTSLVQFHDHLLI